MAAAGSEGGAERCSEGLVLLVLGVRCDDGLREGVELQRHRERQRVRRERPQQRRGERGEEETDGVGARPRRRSPVGYEGVLVGVWGREEAQDEEECCGWAAGEAADERGGGGGGEGVVEGGEPGGGGAAEAGQPGGGGGGTSSSGVNISISIGVGVGQGAHLSLSFSLYLYLCLRLRLRLRLQGRQTSQHWQHRQRNLPSPIRGPRHAHGHRHRQVHGRHAPHQPPPQPLRDCAAEVEEDGRLCVERVGGDDGGAQQPLDELEGGQRGAAEDHRRELGAVAAG
jgi:hypothetical protein